MQLSRQGGLVCCVTNMLYTNVSQNSGGSSQLDGRTMDV